MTTNVTLITSKTLLIKHRKFVILSREEVVKDKLKKENKEKDKRTTNWNWFLSNFFLKKWNHYFSFIHSGKHFGSPNLHALVITKRCPIKHKAINFFSKQNFKHFSYFSSYFFQSSYFFSSISRIETWEEHLNQK